MCVHVYLRASVGTEMVQVTEKARGSRSGIGVIGSCEPLTWLLGTQSRVLCKSSKHTQILGLKCDHHTLYLFKPKRNY